MVHFHCVEPAFPCKPTAYPRAWRKRGTHAWRHRPGSFPR
ncbi:hypothetical protein C882_4411 [Caenispirillum salinarum AK4]|uniref:Uncharacterized protein n=1 Tax=Caenispirillum salinarum AK4 TaxID=1238182 RepID=K9GYS9_9PROT|nr:hypothetical protein C882_4411 [Caenispirillum salinarum AK4]